MMLYLNRSEERGCTIISDGKRKIVEIFPAPDVRKAIDMYDEERDLGESAKLIPTRLNLYVNTVKKAVDFLLDGDRGELSYEDPNVPFRYHSVIIDLKNDEFEGDEIREFTDILNAFDSIDFVGSSTGDIKIILIFDGIYEKN